MTRLLGLTLIALGLASAEAPAQSRTAYDWQGIQLGQNTAPDRLPPQMDIQRLQKATTDYYNRLISTGMNPITAKTSQ